MKPATWRTAAAAVLLLAGFALFALGHLWAPLVLSLLPDSAPGYWLELIVPFLPMAFVAAGAVLLVNSAWRDSA